jgi:hypothetical protein
VTIDSSEVRGLAFSAPPLRNYIIAYRSRSPVETGYIIHDSLNSFAALADNDTFCSIAEASAADVKLPSSLCPEFTEEFGHRRFFILRYAEYFFVAW